MFIPEHFNEPRSERLETLIHDYPFGMLATVDGGLPFVSHIPFLHERRGADASVLLGHLAKANPQWRHLASGQTALAVFQGPHAYVSPSWYGSPGVPTWNYATVHIYGKARIFETDAETESFLERLTRVYESSQPNPWKANLTGERRASLLGAIVGFEIAAAKVEGKFKLSQNRPDEDQRAVIERFEKSGTQLNTAVANLMKQNANGKL